MIEGVFVQVDVQLQVDEAEAFEELAVGLAPVFRPVVRFGADRQVRLLVEVDDVAEGIEIARLAARVQRFHADAAALKRIYADDFIGVGPSGTVRTKPQVISDFTSGDLRFQSITTDDVRVRVYGNAAVETGRSTMDGQDKGKAVPHDTRFTRVWVKQHGRWRLVANHYSSIVSHQ